MTDLSPVKLLPAFKDYLWGGTKLKSVYNKKSNLDILAESWELSAHKDGQSIIADGKYQGLKLTEYINTLGNDILGKKAKKFDYFPILIKFIDAKNNLSVQVHPNDNYALKNEGEYGKTEMWYILDCESKAFLYYGFKRDISKEEYEDAIKNNTLTEILNAVPVHKGDVFFIPSGTVHAIGAGIMICEIQQNSNTTYRVYDYGRRDKNGNTRPLHIQKAIDVSNLSKSSDLKPVPQGNDVILASCDYFTVRKLTVENNIEINITDESFQSFIAVEGCGVIKMNGNAIEFNKGDSIFIPAQNSSYTIQGKCEIILSSI